MSLILRFYFVFGWFWLNFFLQFYLPLQYYILISRAKTIRCDWIKLAKEPASFCGSRNRFIREYVVYVTLSLVQMLFGRVLLILTGSRINMNYSAGHCKAIFCSNQNNKLIVVTTVFRAKPEINYIKYSSRVNNRSTILTCPELRRSVPDVGYTAIN